MGAELKKKMGQTFFLTCATSLWLSYVIFRIILFPYWLYVFGNDITWIVISLDLANNDAYKDSILLQLNNDLNLMEKYGNPIVIFVLFIMSSVWFYKITKGFLKVLQGQSPEELKNKNKKE